MLDGGIFDGCSFYSADLTGCSLKNASLRRCNLRRARLGGLDLGALPALRPFGSCADAGAGGGGPPAAAAAAADKKAREEMIGRVEVSADGTVVAVLSGDGRSGKVCAVLCRAVPCVCACVCACVFILFFGWHMEVSSEGALVVRLFRPTTTPSLSPGSGGENKYVEDKPISAGSCGWGSRPLTRSDRLVSARALAPTPPTLSGTPRTIVGLIAIDHLALPKTEKPQIYSKQIRS